MVLATIFGLLRKLDIYGHKISVHYKGDDVYRTFFGGILTLTTYIFVVIHSIRLVNDFTDHSAQTENYTRIKQKLFDQGEFNLRDQ